MTRYLHGKSMLSNTFGLINLEIYIYIYVNRIQYKLFLNSYNLGKAPKLTNIL